MVIDLLCFMPACSCKSYVFLCIGIIQLSKEQFENLEDVIVITIIEESSGSDQRVPGYNRVHSNPSHDLVAAN